MSGCQTSYEPYGYPQSSAPAAELTVLTGCARWRAITIGILAVLVATLLAFAPTDVRVKRGHPVPPQWSPGAVVSSSTGSESTGTGRRSLNPSQQASLEANQATMPGDLGGFARPWLPWVTQCRSSTDPDGPSLLDGEAHRVRCSAGSDAGPGAIAVHFVAYRTSAERDRARALAASRNREAEELVPGVAVPNLRSTASGNTVGSYIEYAYRITVADRTDQVVAGLWWDDATRSVAGYLLALWAEELGGTWAPLRDLWQDAA